jgi:phosphoribosylformimino-5-aminoimidazole carboxamide ribotide isomerase
MVIIPAIDILDGRCVRLRQGNYDEASRYDIENPAERAKSFAALGIKRIHIVDLDAAKGQGKNNLDVIAEIRRVVDITIEVGGGIRSQADVERLIDIGIDRLILGTVLVRDPEIAASWASRYGKKFIAGIDARDGVVKVSGWLESGGITDTALAAKAADMGMCSVIYTNIARDGMLSGPDFERTVLVARSANLPVIVSGGVGSDEDILAAAKYENEGIAGIITGKAVYEGKIDLPKLLQRLSQKHADSSSW